MLKYKIVKQRNALSDTKEEMYYPRLTERIKRNLDDVAEMISDQSSLSKGDVLSTLMSLEGIIPKLLRSGNQVELGDLGTFSLHAKGNSSSTKSEVSWRSFQKIITRFRAGKALEISLAEVHFSKSSKE